MKAIFHRYKHAWTLLYFAIYLPWFFYLERTVTSGYHLMHIPLDDYIPFNEYFIIPYLLWFLYVATALVYFFFTDKKGYYRLFAFLAAGMTASLLICTIFPNGTNLRPAVDPQKNLCSLLVSVLYQGDTCTNVFPSVHVFNSVAVHIAAMKSQRLKRHRLVQAASLALMVSICLSTVFLKQHSAVDGFGSILLACLIYQFVYGNSYASENQKETQKVLS